MGDFYLCEPGLQYKESFQHYAEEYVKNNIDLYASLYKPALQDFETYVEKLQDYAKGLNVPAGLVPFCTYWLTDGNGIYGVIRVRHFTFRNWGHIGYDITPCMRGKGLATLMLKMALPKAEELGLKEVIITCRSDNLSSARVIEKNGGRLITEIYDEEEMETLRVYSINLE